MYVVCAEHLEIAIEQYLDEYERAPDLVDLTQRTMEEFKLERGSNSEQDAKQKLERPFEFEQEPERDLPKQCMRCAEPGRYLVL